MQKLIIENEIYHLRLILWYNVVILDFDKEKGE